MVMPTPASLASASIWLAVACHPACPPEIVSRLAVGPSTPPAAAPLPDATPWESPALCPLAATPPRSEDTPYSKEATSWQYISYSASSSIPHSSFCALRCRARAGPGVMAWRSMSVMQRLISLA